MTAVNAVEAKYTYPEGGTFTITVQVDGSWPDGLDEARRQATRGLLDAMGEVEHAEDEE